MPYTFRQYTLLGPDFTVLLDNIDEYYNVGQYDYSCDSELFYNDLVAVRVGATDWYLPDGRQWPRLYFNSKYMFIDHSGKTVSSSRYDEVSHENDRWFGCHGTTEYLLDSTGTEKTLSNNRYAPSAWAAAMVEQAQKRGIQLNSYMPYRLNIHRDEFCELAWQTIQTVNPNINLPEPAQPFSDCDEDIVRQIAALGIVTGYEDGTFQPTRELSRQGSGGYPAAPLYGAVWKDRSQSYALCRQREYWRMGKGFCLCDEANRYHAGRRSESI